MVLLWKMYIIENMIKNRVLSLLLIVAVYLLAVAGGLACFKFLQGQGSFSFELILLLADIFATVIVFIFSLIFRNASVYSSLPHVFRETGRQERVEVFLLYLLSGSPGAYKTDLYGHK